MERAARAAADPRVLEAVDAVRIVNLLSWRYRDPGLLLAQRIGASTAATRYTSIGGNIPQSLVNQACLDIQQGRNDVVLIAGGETWRSRTRIRAQGHKLTGTVQDDSVPLPAGADDEFQMSGPAEIRIGLDRPAYVYPMFEQALRIASGGSRPRSTGAGSVRCGRGSAKWHRTIRMPGTRRRCRPRRSGSRVRPTA